MYCIKLYMYCITEAVLYTATLFPTLILTVGSYVILARLVPPAYPDTPFHVIIGSLIFGSYFSNCRMMSSRTCLAGITKAADLVELAGPVMMCPKIPLPSAS